MEIPKSEKFAQLLLKAGILRQEEVCDAMEISESLKKTVDQVLMTSGFMTAELSQNCQEALSYIERGIVSEQLALDGLKMSHKKSVKFKDGLSYFGWGW